MDSKIFCIGLPKTGTTSLGAALELLGYRVHGVFGFNDPNIATAALPRALALVPHYDAFQDNPWWVLYDELDARFPGSRFILTLRPEEAWIASVVAHFGRSTSPMRTWTFGVSGGPRGNEDVYLQRYRRHSREVMEHFAGRPGDLLVLDFSAGHGWAELAAFLGHPVPDLPYPHTNTRVSPVRRRITRNWRRWRGAGR